MSATTNPRIRASHMLWLACALLAIPGLVAAADPPRLRIAAASTAADTGIIQALADDFKTRHPGLNIEVRSLGALIALDEGRLGRADLVITHVRTSEELFVEEGYGLRRVQFMYDDYALFGPPADPLKLGRESELLLVLRRLAQARVPFLAPAPQSGTAKKIAQLWEAAGVIPDWPGYEVTGTSAAATLHQAAQFDSYTIANLSIFLANRNLLAGNITPLFRDHPLLRNTYSALPVNADKVAGVQAGPAREFLAYLVSDAGQSLINRYGERDFETRLFTAAANLDPVLKAAQLAKDMERKNQIISLLVVLTVALAAFLSTFVVFTRRIRRAETARRASEERFVLAVSGTSDALWDWNLQTGEVYFSPRWKELLGYVGYDDEIENNISEWKDRIHPDDRELVLAILDSYIEGRSPHFTSQHRLRTKRGDYLWVLERGKMLWDKSGQPLRLSGSVTDITSHRLQTERVEHQTLHDILTDLPNRSLFLDRLEHALHTARRHDHALTVMIVNLDHFQDINQSHGREAGDQVLREVTRRLRASLRTADTSARLGNDEFGLLLPATSPQQAILPLHRLLKVLEAPVSLDSQALRLTATIGVAHFPEHGDQTELLLQRAQIAMYSARRQRAGFGVYEPPAAAANRA